MQTTGGQNVRKEGGRAGCLSTLLPDFHAMPDSAKRHGMKIRVTVSALLFRRFGKPRRSFHLLPGPPFMRFRPPASRPS